VAHHLTQVSTKCGKLPRNCGRRSGTMPNLYYPQRCAVPMDGTDQRWA
jgi:hypothetical protein